VHFIGQRCHAVRVAEADLAERVQPHRDHQRHGLFELAGSGVRLLQALARLPDQADVRQMKTEHCQHRDLRVGDEADEALLGGCVRQFHGGQRTLQRFAGRIGSALEHVGLSPRGACGK
jgi:hypothetical protein